MAETAGERKQRAKETTSIANLGRQFNDDEGARVQWIFTSCLTHTFIVPTKEMLALSCQFGNYQDEQFGIECSDDGFAVTLTIEDLGLDLKYWRTTETWKQVEFEQRSMRTILNEFVSASNPVEQFSVTPALAVEPMNTLLEDCAGPNCIPSSEEERDQPSCQGLVEFSSANKDVSLVMQGFWFLLFVPLIVSLIMRSKARTVVDLMHEETKWSKEDDDMSTTSNIDSDSSQSSIEILEEGKSHKIKFDKPLSIRKLNVSALPDRMRLLDNVDLDFKRGSITGLCGVSNLNVNS